MATIERFIPVMPEAIWDVLADPAEYGEWIVGSKTVRDADDGFPAPGTRFHHAVGIGPLTVRDHTEVVAVEPARLLRLRAKARPVGTAAVQLELKRADGGTTVRMSERPDGVFAPLALNPLVHLVIKLRNAESLRRLERLALRRVARRAA
jgi:uncharacterized protein YndB with AHSA1/START domain